MKKSENPMDIEKAKKIIIISPVSILLLWFYVEAARRPQWC